MTKTPNKKSHTIKVPTIKVSSTYHVGTMDKAHKGTRGSSYEGNGLSISPCPGSWVRIARLGGLPWWKLTHIKPAPFIDFHKAKKGKKWEQLQAWALDMSYIRLVTVYHAEWYDEDIDDTVRWSYLTKKEAEYQLAGYEDGKVRKEHDCPVLTEIAAEKVGLKAGDPSDAKDGVILAFALDNGYEGVWWQDRHDPDNYSAPRGVILPDKVAGWLKANVQPDDEYEDEDEEFD